MKYKAIIFDLDGTLINSLYDIADAINYVLSKNNFQTHDYSAYKKFVGRGLRNLLLSALPQNMTHSESFIESCIKDFGEYYGFHCFDKTSLYDRIPELLDFIQDNNLNVCVLSNKAHDFTTMIVDKLFSTWKFNIVLGHSEKTKRKPNPEAAINISKELNLNCNEILFVGDSIFDVETAKAAGMTSVAVSWGFSSKTDLSVYKPDYIVDNPLEILDILKKERAL